VTTAADHRGQAVPAADRAVDRALLASTIRAVFDNGSVNQPLRRIRLVLGYITTRSAQRRARHWICWDNGIEPEIVQYLKTPPSRAELEKLIADAGIDVRTAVRKRESLYTELWLPSVRRPTARRHGRTSDPDRAPLRRHARHSIGQPIDAVRRFVTWRLIGTAAAGGGHDGGCGPAAPDYRASGDHAHPTTTTTTGAPLPLSQYHETVGVGGQTVAPDRLTDLTVTLPTPPGWHCTPTRTSHGHPDDRQGATYPSAMLLVFQLSGDFDVAEALSTPTSTPNSRRTSRSSMGRPTTSRFPCR